MARINREKPDTTIGIGDRVRSYDFPDMVGGDHPAADSYVEGVVFGMGERDSDGNPFTCRMYFIRPTHRCTGRTGRREVKPDDQYTIYAPVNGTPSTMGGVTYGVVRVGL